jgi:hypothetical protein
MKNHFRRDGFWVTALVFLGPLVIGVVTTIIFQTVRGATQQLQASHAERDTAPPEKSN